MPSSRPGPEEGATTAPHWHWDGDRLHLSLQGKAGARHDAFGRVMAGRLQVHIACIAEEGRATDRLISFLARSFGVPRRAVTVVYGRASPIKAVCIESPTRLPPDAGVTPRSS